MKRCPFLLWLLLAFVTTGGSAETSVKTIEDAFKEFTNREDIAIIMINQYVRNADLFMHGQDIAANGKYKYSVVLRSPLNARADCEHDQTSSEKLSQGEALERCSNV